MAVGDRIEKVTGYVTQDKYLVGRSLGTLERYLGFHEGRLAHGATFVRLDRLPTSDEFELAAYSMTAAHRHVMPSGLNVSKLKALAMSRWTLSGPDRLVKVLATIRHDDTMSNDDQYPPGSGVPQWRLLPDRSAIKGTVVAVVHTRSDIYRPQL